MFNLVSPTFLIKADSILLISYDILSQVLMEYFLVVLYPRLIKRIYMFHGSFIGNGEEEEIHECPNVEWCQFADGNVTAHPAYIS